MRYLGHDDDETLDRMWGADVPAHTCHALYLGAETTPGRPVTLPPDGAIHWPLLAPPAAEETAESVAEVTEAEDEESGDAAAASGLLSALIDPGTLLGARSPSGLAMPDPVRRRRRVTSPEADAAELTAEPINGLCNVEAPVPLV